MFKTFVVFALAAALVFADGSSQASSGAASSAPASSAPASSAPASSAAPSSAAPSSAAPVSSSAAPIQYFVPFTPCPAHYQLSADDKLVTEYWSMFGAEGVAQKTFTPMGDNSNTTILARSDIKNGTAILMVTRVEGDGAKCEEEWLEPASSSVIVSSGSEPEGMPYDSKKTVDCPDGSKDCTEYCYGENFCWTADSKNRFAKVGNQVYKWFDDVKMDEFTMEPCEGGNQDVKNAPENMCTVPPGPSGSSASIAKVFVAVVAAAVAVALF